MDLCLRISYFFAMYEQMRENTYLSEFEMMVMLTILRLEEEPYGIPIAKELSILRGREVALGTVYAALDRLELKGLVASELGESTPERGGRAKRYFRVTNDGIRAAQDTRRVLSKLWKSLPSLER